MSPGWRRCFREQIQWISLPNHVCSSHTGSRIPVILVLGGSFDPIHSGHVQMFQAAADACQREGERRLAPITMAQARSNERVYRSGLYRGGFLAVASDSHVRAKGSDTHIVLRICRPRLTAPFRSCSAFAPRPPSSAYKLAKLPRDRFQASQSFLEWKVSHARNCRLFWFLSRSILFCACCSATRAARRFGIFRAHGVFS